MKGKKDMQLSTAINLFVCTPDGTYEPYRQELRRYASLGFNRLDAIFCAAAQDGSPLDQPDWLDWVQAVHAEAVRLGLSFDQLHLPFYNFCHPQTGIDSHCEDKIRRSIQCAAILGAPWAVLHPATAIGESLVPTFSLRRNLDYFRPHLAWAASCGVGICIENMPDIQLPGCRRRYCATVEELCVLVDTLAAEFANVGICWDFGHANLTYADQVPALAYLGQRLKVTHVHDNRGSGDEHLPPYLGTIKWASIMPALTSLGYTGDFSFEIRRFDTAVPAELQDSLWRHVRAMGEYLLSLAG